MCKYCNNTPDGADEAWQNERLDSEVGEARIYGTQINIDTDPWSYTGGYEFNIDIKYCLLLN